MAKTVTRGTLRTDLRNRFEISDNFVTDTEANRMLQVAYNDYYTFITNINPDYYLSSSTISITSGTDTYSLPNDFYKAHGVDVQDGSKWVPLETFSWSERNLEVSASTEKRDTTYRIMGSNIVLMPVPGWSGSIKLWYLPAPADFSSDSTTIDGISGFEEYVILHALIQYCGKAEEDPTLFAAQLSALKEQMKPALDRNTQDPDRLRDAYGESGYLYSRRGLYPRLGR